MACQITNCKPQSVSLLMTLKQMLRWFAEPCPIETIINYACVKINPVEYVNFYGKEKQKLEIAEFSLSKLTKPWWNCSSSISGRCAPALMAHESKAQESRRLLFLQPFWALPIVTVCLGCWKVTHSKNACLYIWCGTWNKSDWLASLFGLNINCPEWKMWVKSWRDFFFYYDLGVNLWNDPPA